MEDKVPIIVKNDIPGLPKTTPLYYEDPYLKVFEAEVLKVIDLEGFSYVVLDRTCFFPEGGGQPGDEGYLFGSSSRLKVVDTQVVDDVIVHISVPNGKGIKEGDSVRGSIIWDLRYERMKQHTGSHVLFSAIKRVLRLDRLVYMGVEIKEDASRIDISYGKAIPGSKLREIESLSNEVCLENREVKTWFTTRDEAERTYGERLGITEITPSGVVRVVEVGDWDVALCSGTHVKSTNEIGLIHIIDRFRLKKGVERIEFTAGKKAYQRYNDAMETLTNVAQMLSSSTAEVPVRVESLLKVNDDLKRELRMAREQLVEVQTLQLIDQAKVLGEFRLLKKQLSTLDAQTLKWIASSLVKKDPYLIAVLGSDAGNKAFLVGAAGCEAVKKGMDMAEMIRVATQIIQGGGGGNTGLAQAGGKAPDRLEEALRLYAKEVSERLLAQAK